VVTDLCGDGGSSGTAMPDIRDWAIAELLKDVAGLGQRSSDGRRGQLDEQNSQGEADP